VVPVCINGDVQVEHSCRGVTASYNEGGTTCAESVLIAVPRTTVYTLSVSNESPTVASLYDSGAQVDVYIGWGWWGSAWPYAVLPVPGSDPFGIDTTHSFHYWAVFCARQYDWAGFVPLNKFSVGLDYDYSIRGADNKCPLR